jgi:ParB/RepB/Spo0J family partition protein
MMETLELNRLDLRLEHTRTRDNVIEQSLLQSIAQRGILDPLHVAGGAQEQEYILLDGFKRYRCARKLGMGMVAAQIIAGDLATGILAVIRRGDYDKGITTLEQAALIEELHKRCGLTIYDIALQLDRSPSWVSMRLGMIEELSDLVREKIMSGAFPARAYLYGIKGFTRVNNVSSRRVDAFVAAVSGKGLSTRELFVLSRAYFTGGTTIERLIGEGDARRALALLCDDPEGDEDPGLCDRERLFIKDLAAASACISRIIGNDVHESDGTASFMQYVNLWSRTILKHLEKFKAVVHELYYRSEPANRGADHVPAGCGPQGDSAAVAP